MNRCRGNWHWDCGISSAQFFRAKFLFLIPSFLWVKLLGRVAHTYIASDNGTNRFRLISSPISQALSSSVNMRTGQPYVTLAASTMPMTIYHTPLYLHWIIRQWHGSSRRWHIKMLHA